MKSNKKPTNPKDAIGSNKVPFSTIPAPVMAEVGLAMLEGSIKYGRHNYRAIGVRSSIYYDAALRHLTAWWEGEDIDPDSNLSHLSKAMACMVVLRDSMRRGNLNDDRPPSVKSGWVQELNAEAKKMIESFDKAEKPYTK